MEWILDKDKPICPQLGQIISFRIATGIYKPNEKLPTVRQLAVEAGVNPNTVQKTFEQLQSRNVIYAKRCSGWFVESDISYAKEDVKNIIKEKTAEYFEEMKKLGLNKEDVKSYIKEWDNECTSKM